MSDKEGFELRKWPKSRQFSDTTAQNWRNESDFRDYFFQTPIISNCRTVPPIKHHNRHRLSPTSISLQNWLQKERHAERIDFCNLPDVTSALDDATGAGNTVPPPNFNLRRVLLSIGWISWRNCRSPLRICHGSTILELSHKYIGQLSTNVIDLNVKNGWCDSQYRTC